MENISTIWKGWEICERIGSGSFGEVYKIRRNEYGFVSYAAMKIIEIPRDQREIAELADTGMSDADIRRYYREMVNSLQKEIQIMEDLKGAVNIVAIEDYTIREHAGGIGWSIYIRMELLESINEYRSRAGGLTLSEVLHLGIDMCTALENCESMGITHRDIKPDNIFRNKYGNFKLGDFGIARQIQTMTLLMHSQKGTTTYMAPEVIRKEQYDSSVDVYSLGIMLYRFLNHNRLPYMPRFPEQLHPDDFPAAMQKRMAGAPMKAPDEADGELSKYVMKACAYKPEDRYASAADLRRDLAGYLYRLTEGVAGPEGNVPKEMHVAYDPFNMKQSYGAAHTGIAGEETMTLFQPAPFDEATQIAEAYDEQRQQQADLAAELADEAADMPGASGAAEDRETISAARPDPNQKLHNQGPPQPEQKRPGGRKKEQSPAGHAAADAGPAAVPTGASGSSRKRPRLAKKWKAFLIVVMIFAAGCAGCAYFVSQYGQVPDVEGLSKAEARKTLEAAGFTMAIDTSKYSDEVEKGCIISQDPDSGKYALKAKAVKVVVSKGTDKVAVPNVVGMTQEEAEDTLEAASLAVKVETTNNLLRESGVIEQSVAEGELVRRGTVIIITVNESTVRDDINNFFNGNGSNGTTDGQNDGTTDEDYSDGNTGDYGGGEYSEDNNGGDGNFGQPENNNGGF